MRSICWCALSMAAASRHDGHCAVAIGTAAVMAPAPVNLAARWRRARGRCKAGHPQAPCVAEARQREGLVTVTKVMSRLPCILMEGWVRCRGRLLALLPLQEERGPSHRSGLFCDDVHPR